MKPTVLVVGTGSIGSRHITNLLRLGANVLTYSYRRGTRPEPWRDAVRSFEDLDQAFKAEPDAIVIANRTDQHMEVALRGARDGRALFIEKPLSHSLAGVEALVAESSARRLVIECGFMLRLHPNLIWLRSFLQGGGLGDLFYCRAAVGQYLPDWRPSQDYRASYSASSNCGGVIFDLVHELDLMAWLLGPIDTVQAMTTRAGGLEIDSESVAQIGLRSAAGVVAQVHLDYVRPVYVRTMEVVGSGGIAEWDYTRGAVTITEPKREAKLAHSVAPAFDRNDLFLAHMRYFLARLVDPTLPTISSLEDGIAALRAALACRLAAATARVVALSEMDRTSPASAIS